MKNDREQARTLRLRAWGFLLAAFGGFLAALGSMLQWTSLPEFAGTSSISGIDLGPGKIALVAGLTMIIAVFAMRFQPTYERRQIAGVTVLSAAFAAVGAASGSLLSLTSVTLGSAEEQARALSRAMGVPFEAALATVRTTPPLQPEAGLLVVLGGGVLGVLGAWVSLRWAKRRAALNEAAGEPFGAHRAFRPAGFPEKPEPQGSL